MGMPIDFAARREVVSVEETTVTLNITVHLDNGKKVFTSRDLDMSDIEYSPLDNIYVIASTLKSKDSINKTLSIPEPTINQALTRQHEGMENRTINFLDHSTLYQSSLYESAISTRKLQYCESLT